jgi:hypothetical protein
MTRPRRRSKKANHRGTEAQREDKAREEQISRKAAKPQRRKEEPKQALFLHSFLSSVFSVPLCLCG